MKPSLKTTGKAAVFEGRLGERDWEVFLPGGRKNKLLEFFASCALSSYMQTAPIHLVPFFMNVEKM